jgi:hypothetical protein
MIYLEVLSFLFQEYKNKYFAGDSTTLQKLVNKKYWVKSYGKL